MPVATEVHTALDAVLNGASAHDVESETLDFKTVGRSVDDTLTDLAQAAACFANAKGGSIVVGVADHPGGADAFVGCVLDPPTTRLQIFERTEPPLTVSIEWVARPEGAVLVIGVPESPTLHSVKGRVTERVGTSCMPMHTERIAQVMADRRGDDWSDHPTELALAAVDPVAMAIGREFLEASGDPTRQGYARLSDPDLLRVLGVVTADGTLNQAGALLFTKQTSRRELMAYIHRRTPTGALTANEPLDGPLISALGRVFDLIAARVDRTSVNVGRGQQLQIADLPEAAVREAVVNAVMHRDYQDTARTTIEHAATRMVVTSPGPFVSGVSVANVLTTASRSRNPRLAEAIRKLGLAETAGTGVDRMYASMARVGHQPPIFEADRATVRVTLVGGAPNEFLTRFVTTLPPGTGDDADTMLVLLTLLGRRTVSAADMSPALQKSAVEVQSVLGRLAAPPLALVEPTRESSRRALPTYRLCEAPLAALGPAVTYRRRTADSSDRRILALVREAGTINSRMVKVLLDTDTVTTSRILADLVDRGMLTKTSRATRGPGVTYGPGPDLPKTKAKARRSMQHGDVSAHTDKINVSPTPHDRAPADDAPDGDHA